jgi:hypothetical protein
LLLALRTELNLGLAKRLLSLAEKALNEGHHNHIGSSNLWARHNASVCKLNNKLSEYQLKEVSYAVMLLEILCIGHLTNFKIYIFENL